MPTMTDDAPPTTHPDAEVPDAEVPDAEVPAAPTRSRARLIALIASGAALLLVAAIVIAFLVSPRGQQVALVDDDKPDAPATASPTESRRPTATPTASPTAAPVAAAPAPAAPAPAAPAKPAPANPAPVLPAPPAPVIPALKIDAMDATATTACGPHGHILITWSASGALAKSAVMNVRSGGGTPIFNESWTGYQPVDQLELLTVDCTRPIWFFKLTVSNGTSTKSALLTFANGKNVGWS
jgi:hypothetical protein